MVNLSRPVFVVPLVKSRILPDIVMSARFRWFGRWTLRSALVFRKLSAISSFDSDTTGTAFGYGFNVGGTIKIPTWNENDNIKFQVVLGRGIGRYINDTNTIDGQDAVFDPTGDLKALPIAAGYASFQHWWSAKLRSTFLYSVVRVDTFDFQPHDSYSLTQRATANMLWSPISRIDVGGELLWGRRENRDKNSATAKQIQLQAKYRF